MRAASLVWIVATLLLLCTQPGTGYNQTIRETFPDVFQGLPVSFDAKYKNPCWHDEQKHFHCLPFFQILGKDGPI